MKEEYDMSHAYRNPYADKLPQLSSEQLRKLASGEADLVSERTVHVSEDGKDYILKEIVVSV